MTTYAIGDIQGCFDEFQCLLEKINFNHDKDQLWLAGDLINRGPKSLETLQFCYERRDNIVAVQGNHDLHFLAVAAGTQTPKRKDTFTEILKSPQLDHYIEWLASNPLLHCDEKFRVVMVHAGIAPCWTLDQARHYAREVEAVLTSDARLDFFNAMYGNTPKRWSDDLQGTDRLRAITNYFTRMRLCESDGSLDLSYKGTLADAPDHLVAWFDLPSRLPREYKVLFGHWAALNGHTGHDHLIALDTGCVWGNQLTAYCLETGQLYRCPCRHD